MLYLSKLRVQHNGAVKFSNADKEASKLAGCYPIMDHTTYDGMSLLFISWLDVYYNPGPRWTLLLLLVLLPNVVGTTSGSLVYGTF